MGLMKEFGNRERGGATLSSLLGYIGNAQLGPVHLGMFGTVFFPWNRLV